MKRPQARTALHEIARVAGAQNGLVGGIGIGIVPDHDGLRQRNSLVELEPEALSTGPDDRAENIKILIWSTPPAPGRSRRATRVIRAPCCERSSSRHFSSPCSSMASAETNKRTRGTALRPALTGFAAWDRAGARTLWSAHTRAALKWPGARS